MKVGEYFMRGFEEGRLLSELLISLVDSGLIAWVPLQHFVCGLCVTLDTHAGGQRQRDRDRHTDRQTETKRQRQRERETDRQTERDRQTDRQTDRLTD